MDISSRIVHAVTGHPTFVKENKVILSTMYEFQDMNNCMIHAIELW